jgi:hypothetical protein
VKHRKRQWQATNTKICASTAKDSTTGKTNAEQEFKTINPARTARAENIGRDDTPMRKRHKDQHNRFQH